MKNKKNKVTAAVITVVLFLCVFLFSSLKSDEIVDYNKTSIPSEKSTSLDLEKLQAPVYITVFKFILNTSLLK